MLEHVAKALLTPAAARFRAVPQRIDQPRGLGAHLLLPLPHGLDREFQLAIAADPLLLDVLETFLIALERIFNGLEQQLEAIARIFLGLIEVLAGLCEQLRLRLIQQPRADFVEFERGKLAGIAAPLTRDKPADHHTSNEEQQRQKQNCRVHPHLRNGNEART